MNDVETDIITLLECLKCQQNNFKALCRTLMTLSSLLTQNEEAKDVFREENGIQFVFKLMTKASTPELKHSIMFCLACAVDKNVLSQSVVNKREIFEYLHQILKDTGNNNEKIQQTAIFLLLCIVASNSVGQSLANESQCLDDLILIFRKLLGNSVKWNTSYKGLWCSLNSALSMCVNNPQNESNQRKCCILFPQAFKCISENTDPEILRPVLALLGLSVANNVCNQDRIRRCGGIEVLLSQIKTWIQLVHTDCDYLSLAVNGVGTLDSCISDNEENCKEMVELNGIDVLFLLLSHDEIDNIEKLQIILTLGHCLDDNSEKRYILKTRERNILIQILTQTQDEELMKAVKYVLQIGNRENSSTKEKDIEGKSENNPNSIILQKIAELSNKLDCMDTEIKSKQSEGIDIEYWMNRNNNRCNDTTVNKSFESPRQVVQDKTQVKIDSFKSDHDALTNHSIQPTTDVVDIFTKFTNFLRSSFNQSKADESAKDGNLDLSNQDRYYTSNVVMHPQMNQNQKHFGPSADPRKSSALCSSDFIEKTVHHNFNGKQNGVNTKSKNDFNTTADNSCNLAKFCSPDSVLTPHERCDNTVQAGHSKRMSTEMVQHGNKDQERSLTLSYLKSPVENWPSDMNDTTQGIPDEGSYNYRNNSTALAGSCQDHDQRHHRHQGSKQENPRMSVHNHSIQHCCHSTPKENRYEEQSQRKQQCVQPELLRIASESPIYYETSAVDSSHISMINMSTQTQSRITADALQEEPEICNPAPNNKKLQKRNTLSMTTQTENGDCERPVSDVLMSVEFNHQQTENKNGALIKDRGSQTSNDIDVQCMIKDSLGDGEIFKSIKDKKKILSTNINSELGDDNALDGFSLMDLFDGPNAKSKANNQPLRRLTKNPKADAKTVETQLQNPKNKISNADLIQAISEASTETGSETFLKPNVPAIRRRIRHTPSLGSSVSSRPSLKQTVQDIKQMEKASERSTEEHARALSCPSPALSEFDFTLVQKAKSGNYCQERKTDYTKMARSQLPSSGLNSAGTSSPATTSSTPMSINSASNFSTELDEGSSDDEDLNSEKISESSERYQPRRKCPGCQPAESGVMLNSRTYNIILESSQYTCHYHRELRQVERDYIHSITSEQGKTLSHPQYRQIVHTSDDVVKDKSRVYDFSSSDSGSNRKISPPHSSGSINDTCRYKTYENRPKRRERIAYTENEIANLEDGVSTIGRYWNQILVTYKFHSSRTAVDLQEKYKRMQKMDKKDKERRKPKPFSMCEERRLRRGIKILGYNWKGILNSYKFSHGRTSEDLRSKWRNLNKLH